MVSAMLDFLTFSLCAPYSETTEGAQFDALLELVANHAGRMVFKLFQHTSIAIVKGAGLVMKAIIEVSAANNGVPQAPAVEQAFTVPSDFWSVRFDPDLGLRS